MSRAVDSLPAVSAVAVATDRARAAELWRYREGHSEAINHHGVPHKLDVSLPTAALAGFVERAPGVVAAVSPSAEVWLFGHAADGNVHVNVTGLAPDDEAVDDAVFKPVSYTHLDVYKRQPEQDARVEHAVGVERRLQDAERCYLVLGAVEVKPPALGLSLIHISRWVRRNTRRLGPPRRRRR